MGAEYTSIQTQLQSARSQIISSETELFSLKSSLQSAQDELSELRTTASDRDTAFAELESSKASLQTRLNELETIKSCLEKKLVEGGEEAEKSLADVTGLGDKVRELEDQIAELENKLGSEKDAWKAEEAKWGETKAVSKDVKYVSRKKKKWMLKNLYQALEKEIEDLKSAGEGHAEELSRASSVAETSKEELCVSHFFLPGVAILECHLKPSIRLSVSHTNNLQPPMLALLKLLPVTRKTLRTSSDS